MPLFSRFKGKGSQQSSKNKPANDAANGGLLAQAKPRYQSQWTSKVIVPEEIVELVHACTAEMKLRAEALDAPFLLLPFRPDSDPQGARSFVRNYFKANSEGSPQYRGADLQQELRLTEPLVLCSIMKWCWSRMPDGVVSWPVYEGFKLGERAANMARNAFHTFIPISSDSPARTSIIIDFFDLIATVAAHGKLNGLTGRKLSRFAGWWAFEHADDGNGFEGGYRTWNYAADAASHLFFGYLRSQSPDTDPSMNVIERIPRSLQALLASTEYPPETPTLLQRTTPRVVMLVDSVSPTPFALLRRAKNFEFRDKDRILREFAEYEDPVDALTDECKRVLFAISSINSTVARSRHGLGVAKPDEAWSNFSNLGFSELDEKAITSQALPPSTTSPAKTVSSTLRSDAGSIIADTGRPTTPSWADFLSAGFTADDEKNKTSTLLLPPSQVIPPLGSRAQTPSSMRDYNGIDDELTPGELAAITSVELDDAFWWVWMSSLAGEETSERKATFGRCALIETKIMNGRWLIVEEQVKGASPDPTGDVFIAPKKGLFSFTRRSRRGRRKTNSKQTIREEAPVRSLSATPSKTNIAPDQQAKIKAAAAALSQRQETVDHDAISRRGRNDDAYNTKTNSTFTAGLEGEAVQAMKWTKAYDKDTIRAQYLGDQFAGRGRSREDLIRESYAASTTKSFTQEEPVTSHKEAELPAVPQSEHYNHEAESSLPLGSVDELPADTSESVFQEPTAHFHEQEHIPGLQSGLEPESPSAAPTALPPVATYQPTRAPTNEPVTVALPASPPSPKSPRVLRKPVSRAEEPAPTRPVYESSASQKSIPAANAAALAAARAMQTNVLTKEDKKQPAQQSGGFKKLFGRKKEVNNRGDSLDMARPIDASLISSTDPNTGRRISVMRKKPVNNAPAVAPVTGPSPYATQAAQLAAANEPHYEPPVDASEHLSEQREREHAEREFSRFDQGPMEDMPASEPQYNPDDLTPEVSQHEFASVSAIPATVSSNPPAHPEYEDAAIPADIPRTRPGDDYHEVPVVQDRWATIRENAAKRAARGSEELSQPSQSQKTDDGDTSGEETIESRVARIKARVAELTGNIDTQR